MSLRRFGAILLVGSVLVLACASIALAQAPAWSPGPPLGGMWLILLLIAYVTRKRPIGGWLMYFVLTSYLGMIVTLRLSLGPIEPLAPSYWASARYYLLYLLSTVPVLLWAICFVVALTILLTKRFRTWRSVIRFRRLLIAGIALDLLPLMIAPIVPLGVANVPFTSLAILNKMIWILYFYRSKRVRRVFLAQDWRLYVQEKYGYKGLGQTLLTDKRVKSPPSSVVCRKCGISHGVGADESAAGYYNCRSCGAKNLVYSINREQLIRCRKCDRSLVLGPGDVASGYYICPSCGRRGECDPAITEIRDRVAVQPKSDT